MITDTGLLQQKLGDITEALPFLLPEGILTAFLLLILLTDLIAGQKGKYWLVIFSLTGFLLHLYMVIEQWQTLQAVSEPVMLLSMLQLNGTAILMKGVFSLAGLLAVLMSIRYQENKPAADQLGKIGEFYVLLFGLLLGTSLMVMSVNLLMLFLAIEIVSISSYILTNFALDKKSAEAGMKYLLFGGVSTGLMLYGMSLLYGFSGSLLITAPAFLEGLRPIPLMPLSLALLLVSTGFLFKISAVPFHIWAPDVYQGAPTPVVAVFSVAPKVAGIAVLLQYSHFLAQLSQQLVILDWQWVAGLIAIATIVVGNFAALSQKNAQRMLAYSSIAHSGFMLIGIVAYSELGSQSILFYAVVYLLMNFAAFQLIKMLSIYSGSGEIRSYRGLGLRYPLLGTLVVVVMVSLTGLPPTAGFTAKLLLFSSLWQTYQLSESTIMLPLLLIGLLNTVVSLFYYMKIPFYLFFKAEEEISSGEKGIKGTVRLGDQLLALMLVSSLLLLFFKADWLLDLIRLVHF